MKAFKCFGRTLAGAVLLLAASPVLGQGSLSPAEQKIAASRRAIEKAPDRHQLYNELALALARRARETGDPAYYEQAERTLTRSFQLQPDNPEGQKVRVWILLGKHEFARARDLATALNKQVPDDILVYGFLTDAHAELGDYEEAEKAAQWMLDMRPGNVPGMTRASYLRELFGDLEGAIELMDAAYQRTAPTDVEDRAWVLTQIAHLQLARGKVDEAERILQQALGLFPKYHYALANLARVRTAQKKHSEAIDLFRQHYQGAPHPENLYLLAEALERAGRVNEAQLAYTEFEGKARAEMDRPDNSNRELIFYYVDHARRPSEALRVARIEIARRRDVYTLHAYAWALHAAGYHAEAREQIEKALAVGIRDAKMLYHAGIIVAAAGEPAVGNAYLKQSLDLAPTSEVADAAREALAR